MIFGLFWSRVLRQVYFGLMLLLEVLLMLAALPFLEEVCYVFVAGVWEAELLVAWAPAGCIVLCQGDEVDKHCAQFFNQLFSFSCVTLS